MLLGGWSCLLQYFHKENNTPSLDSCKEKLLVIKSTLYLHMSFLKYSFHCCITKHMGVYFQEERNDMQGADSSYVEDTEA